MDIDMFVGTPRASQSRWYKIMLKESTQASPTYFHQTPQTCKIKRWNEPILKIVQIRQKNQIKPSLVDEVNRNWRFSN